MGDHVYETHAPEDVIEELGEVFGIEETPHQRFIEFNAPSYAGADYVRIYEE